MMNYGNRKLKIKYNFEVHSFKHLYKNYTYSDLLDYALYLQTIYFNVHFREFFITSSSKMCLVRGIRDIEFSLIQLTDRGFRL